MEGAAGTRPPGRRHRRGEPALVAGLRDGSTRWSAHRLIVIRRCSTVPIGLGAAAEAVTVDVDALVVQLFQHEGASLVRLARLFVDDRNAAEDLVQEAFIRLARAAHRIQDPAKAAAYLRSIVLNLARDHNRRGLVSLRHHLPFDDAVASVEDEIALRDDQRQVLDALRDLPHRQRDCLVLRYYDELGIDDIADDARAVPNSVKTHLQRGLARSNAELGDWTSTTVVSATSRTRLRDALRDGAAAVEESPDLFARVEPQHRRRPARRRRRRAASLADRRLPRRRHARPSRSPSPNLEKGRCSWTGGCSSS